MIHIAETKGQQYWDLLDFAIARSDTVMCVFMGHRRSTKEARKNWAPYRLKTRSNPSWPGHENRNDFDRFYVDVYRATPEIIPFLYEPGALYAGRYPHHPEDLSFFKDNRCWFATVSHENLGWIMRHTKDDIRQVRKMGLDVSADLEQCEVDDLYYEPYKCK